MHGVMISDGIILCPQFVWCLFGHMALKGCYGNDNKLWQSKRDKLSKFKLMGTKVHTCIWKVQKVKLANSRMQKYRATYGRVQKVKPVNSRN